MVQATWHKSGYSISLSIAVDAPVPTSALRTIATARNRPGMSDIATNDAQPAREPRISARMRQALSHLATKGVNQREAAKLAGISEFHLSRELKKPQCQVFIERAARQTIALGLMRAANRTIELVDAGSEHVSLDASKHVLAIAGIKPTADAQVSVNIDIKAGYVIDLTDSAPQHKSVIQTIDHERD